MRAFLTAVFLWLLAGAAVACPVCVVGPDRTAADRLLEDQIAVLARPDPEDPFRFRVTEVLRGDAALLDSLPDIPFLVDTQTRRLLDADPDAAVLMTYGAADTSAVDDPYALPAQEWARSMTVTPERRAVLEQIAVAGQDWFWGGEPEDPPRFAFFAALHDSPDPALQRLALQEISRASYGLIRTLDPGFTVDELRTRLGSPAEIPYQPLYALMLGVHPDPAAAEIVRARAGQALRRTADPQAGAWLTALIERDGAEAVHRIADAYLSGEGPLDDPLLGIIDALRVSGDAVEALRPAIADRLTRAAESWPQMAPEAAYALYGWQDWSFLDAARRIIDAGLLEDDHSALYMLEVYRDTAADFVASGG